SADRRRPPILQPTRTTPLCNLCELVGQSARLCRRWCFSRSNSRLDLRNSGRAVVLTPLRKTLMANREETINRLEPAQRVPLSSATGRYTQPLAIVTTLFFMWGFLTSLNDILVPHLKSIFDLGYAGAMLVQFAFFSAYFLFSIPWSRIVTAIGYQRTMVAGLVSMAVGALLFVPAAASASFPLFLGALVVLA